MSQLKSLSSTFIFKEYDKSLGLTKKMLQFIVDGKPVTREQIAEQINDIEKRYSYHLKAEVVEAFKDGSIIPMTCLTSTARLPGMVPAFAAQGRGKGVNIYVNLTNHSSQAKDGTLNMDTKALYTLLQTGVIYKACFYNLAGLQKHIKFNKSASYVYSSMFTRVLNKSFSLNTFPDKYDEIAYLSSKFFLVNVLQREDNEIVSNIAAGNCKDISRMVLDDLDNRVLQEKESPYASIENLVAFISGNIKGLERLNVRGFLDAFVVMYSAGSLMSLEFLPFFLHTIFSVVIGSFMVNQYSFEPIAKNIDEVIGDFSYIMKH